MSSWLAVQNYSLVLTLLAGLATTVGLGGVGLAVVKRVGVRLPQGFTPLVSLTTGTLLLACCVFFLGILQSTSPMLLSGLLLSVMLIGGQQLLWHVRAEGLGAPHVPRLAAGLFAGVALAALCVAVAPPLHPDDAFYHLLAPARLVADGGLNFYQHPMQAAALSQMGYQLAAAPLHAIGLPGAWAVLGVAFWATLVWLGAVRASEAARGGAGSRAWTGLVVAGLTASFYPTIWYATAGAHAMGDAALAGAVLLALNREGTARERLGPVSVLVVAAACTKLSLLPVVVLVWAAVSAQAWRDAAPSERPTVAALALLPWAVWQAPPLVWTWMESGSPWGPFFAGVLGESVYDLAAIEETMKAAHTSGRFEPARIALFTVGFLNPVLWVTLVWVWVTTLRTRTARVLPLVLSLQVGLVLAFLPLDARYLGGLQYMGLLYLAGRPPAFTVQGLTRPLGLAVAILLTAPWALLGAGEGGAPATWMLGGDTAESYCKDRLPLYESLAEADTLLPPDAALLALRNPGGAGGMLPSAYAPRPIALIPQDLQPGLRPFLFWVGPKSMKAIERAVTQQTSLRLGQALVAPREVSLNTRGRSPRRAYFGLFELEQAGAPPGSGEGSPHP